MNKKTIMRKALAFVLTFVFALVFPTLAFAAELSVNADSTSVKTGDTVTVTIAVSAKRIAVAQGVFTYDPKLLLYVSSNGGASDGHINLVSAQSGGASSLTAVIKFKAQAAGDAKINVSMQSILDYDAKKLENTADAGVLVKVAAGPEKSKEPAKDGAEAPAVDLTQTGVAAKNVQGTDAKMYIWRSLTNLTLPSGYYDRQVEYGGEFVGGAAILDTEFILLYLSEKAGENAGFYVFDKEKNVLFPYVSIPSVLANFTVLWPDDSIKAPDGFDKATLKWKEREVPAWTAKGSDGTVYLVYARNAAGDIGFFLYNSTDKSMQRYQTMTQLNPKPVDKAVADKSDDKPGSVENAGFTIDTTLFMAICAAGAMFLAGAVIFAILYFKNQSRKPYRPKKNMNAEQ